MESGTHVGSTPNVPPVDQTSHLILFSTNLVMVV